MKPSSVIDCLPNRESISDALAKLYSTEFQISLQKVINPLGEGGASERVVEIIRNIEISDLVKKTFYDY